MKQYIDAEKLLAKIERRKKQDITMRERSILIDVETAIESLQQEQPECIYGRTLEEREKYCKFCSAICEARVEQEQPEVDIVKEYDEQFYSDPVYGKLVNRNAGIGIARYFYKLGLKARKG